MSVPEVASEVAGVHASSPFKFLDYFGEKDARQFGGRDREVQDLTSLIVAETILVLYGEAGCGKTSLLLAGLFPELRRHGFFPVYARTLTDPVDDLKLALVGGEGCGAAPDLEVEAAAVAAADGRPLVLVLDQFEEFFIRFGELPTKRQQFLAALNALSSRDDLELRLVFSLRKDYLAELDDLGGILGRRRAVEYRLRSLTPFGARQVILAQLARGAVTYDDAVVTPLVARLAEFKFDPLILQIYCYELYTVAQGRKTESPPRITTSDLAAVGSLDAIFGRYLDSVAAAIPSALHLLTRLILNALITFEGTKRATSLDDLLAERFAADKVSVQLVLARLEDHHIVRVQRRGDELWYELMHERLVPRLVEWMNRDREFKDFAEAQAMVHDHCKSELWRRNPDALLREGILTDLIEPRRDQFRFDEMELEYLFCSALLWRLDSLPYWARRYGMGKATGIVEAWISAGEVEQRAAAAAAMGLLEEAWERLGPACLSLALQDADDAVWQAAAHSLGSRAAERELEKLRLALSDRARRKRACSVLGYMKESGHSLAGFGIWRRWRANGEAERIAVREHLEEFRKRRKVGAFFGAAGGLLWSFTIAPLLMALASGEIVVSHTVEEWARNLALSLAVVSIALPLGGVLGWLAAGTSGRQALFHGEGRWIAVAGRGLKWLLIGFALYILLGLAVFAELIGFGGPNRVIYPYGRVVSNILEGFGLLFAGCLIGVTVFVLGSLLAAWLRTSLGELQKGVQLRLGWLLLSAAPSLLLAAVLAHLLSMLVSQRATLLMWVSIAAAMSVGTLTLASSLFASSAKHPLGVFPAPVSEPGRAVQRSLLLASLILVLAWYGLSFGNLIPPLARVKAYEPRGGITIDFPGEARSNVEFVRVRNNDGPQIFSIARMSRDSTVSIGTNNWAMPGEEMVLPAGTFLASVEREDKIVPAPLRLVPLPPLAQDSPTLGEQRGISLTGLGDLGGVIELRSDQAADGKEVWSGSLSGTASELGRKIRILVSLQFLTSQVPGGVKVNAYTGDEAKPIAVKWNDQESARLGNGYPNGYPNGFYPYPVGDPRSYRDSLTVSFDAPVSLEMMNRRGVAWEVEPAKSGHWWTRFEVRRNVRLGDRILRGQKLLRPPLAAVVVGQPRP